MNCVLNLGGLALFQSKPNNNTHPSIVPLKVKQTNRGIIRIPQTWYSELPSYVQGWVETDDKKLEDHTCINVYYMHVYYNLLKPRRNGFVLSYDTNHVA